MFVSIPQLQPLLIGALAKMFVPHLRLIEEIRDLYSICELVTANKIKAFVLRFLESRLMRFPDGFIFVTPIIGEEYVKHFGKKVQQLKNGKVILNSYDPEDFEDFEESPKYPSRITFCYSGKLYGSRNLNIFLEALGILFQNEGMWREKVSVVIAGEISPDNSHKMKQIIEAYKMDKNIQWLGVLNHGDCIKLQRSANYNLLVTHVSGSNYAIPSKLFEYVAARKPIIAITSDVLVRNIIDEHRIGICFSHEKDVIANGLSNVLRNKISFDEFSVPDEFKRPHQVQQILAVLCNT
jgi:glycosyltransferase involved in cell wall biosynthesis